MRPAAGGRAPWLPQATWLQRTRWLPRAQWLSLAAILATALAASALLLLRGPSCGHDFDFHLVSWLEVARAWHSGLLLPHWAQSPNFGAGEPRFVFYPPLTWLAGALLGCLLGWHAAPWGFTALCLFGSGLAMRRLAGQWLPLPASTAAACLYLASPYLLFVAYERAAYGELMAAVFLPLLLAAALRAHPSPPAVALPLALVWLTNAPSGVMAGYTLAWIALARILLPHEQEPAPHEASAAPPTLRMRLEAPLRLAAGAALGLAMDAFYLVPAVREQRWVEIRRAIGPEMRPADSFLFHHTGEPFHDAVLRTASLLACALLALAAAGVAASGAWRTHRPLRSLAAMLPLLLFLLLPASAPLWHHLPELAFLQFPWRWLLVLGPLAALFLALALARHLGRVGLVAATAGLCALSILGLARPFHQSCDEEDNVDAQLRLMQSGEGQAGTDEYTPRLASSDRLWQDMPRVRLLASPDAEQPQGETDNPEYSPGPAAERPAAIRIERWQPEDISVVIVARAPGFAVLRLMSYPAWCVRRNGVAVREQPRRDDGLLVVPVPAGPSRIEVRWRTTADMAAGRALSAAGLLGWLAALLTERRRRRPGS